LGFGAGVVCATAAAVAIVKNAIVVRMLFFIGGFLSDSVLRKGIPKAKPLAL
jgi:hypothetical protein